MMKTIIWTIAIVCSLVVADLVSDSLFNARLTTKEAQARIGRPMTPLSAAGVARRTTRRVIRRTTVYVATLPRGCTTIVIEGTTLHQCGGTYYQPHGNQFVVVKVD